jgi:Tol biopolymer transport system component
MASPVVPPAIMGFITGATEVPAILPSPTNTSEPTSTPAPTNTPTELPIIPINPIITPTALVPATGRPTESPEPSPTPVGGGQGEIAYASTASGIPQIWLMNADGTFPHQITEISSGACQPAWSPDGTRIVFISPCTFNQELYPGASLFIIDPDNPMTAQQLPTVPGGDFDPAWSPDGKTIAFTSLRDYNRPQIYSINLEDLSVKSLSANISRDSQPVWSPDGEKIAFITTRRGPYQVWIMDKDGKNQDLFSRSGSLKDSHPDWSPDGKYIMYTQAEALGGVPRLAAAPLNSEDFDERFVVTSLTPMREAKYSPDGYRIAYEGWPDGSNHNIFTMSSSGSSSLPSTDSRMNFDPAWRPVVQGP